MHWLYLLLGAFLEAAWTYSLKIMKFSALKTLRWDNFYQQQGGLPVLLPFLGYIAFGIGNIYFFSLAMKRIPAATAFAVWTAITILVLKLVDVCLNHQKITLGELFFLALIIAGIIGLKYQQPGG